MCFMPGPGGADNIFESWVLRSPTQVTQRLGGGCDQLRRIPRAARLLDGWNFLARDVHTCLDHLAYGIAIAVAEIVEALFARRQRKDMRVSQINDVDVIAN